MVEQSRAAIWSSSKLAMIYHLIPLVGGGGTTIVMIITTFRNVIRIDIFRVIEAHTIQYSMYYTEEQSINSHLMTEKESYNLRPVKYKNPSRMTDKNYRNHRTELGHFFPSLSLDILPSETDNFEGKNKPHHQQW